MDIRSKKLREKYLSNPICELDAPISDSRGAIFLIVNEQMESCILVESKKGSVRANHYHKTDWHYSYVMKGEIEYHYRPTGSNILPKIIIIKQGQCFFTPPMVDHTMFFLADTLFICLGRNPRDQKSYEGDVERIVLYEPETTKLL